MFGLGPGALFFAFWMVVIQLGVLVFFVVMSMRLVSAVEKIARELSIMSRKEREA